MFKIFKSAIIFIIIIFSLFYFFYLRSIDLAVSDDFSEVGFSIEKGEGVNAVSEKLLDNNLIKSDIFFKAYLWKNGLDKNLQAGDYILSPSMSMKEIVSLFISGEIVSKERDIKIIEGWNLKNIAESFEKNNIASSKEFLSSTENPVSSWIFDFEKPGFLNELPKGQGLEGYLYPDTYRIFNNAQVGDIVEKALNNFDKKLTNEIRDEIRRQGKTIHEIITMASIIEKEVMKDEDKKIVAGVLYKRLDIGMRLEVDSTINYITGKNDPGALLVDLEINSPYNTYKNGGLPPGPICNPGISSILAAIYPKESEYLFYLNRQDTFETIFSKTYDEHLANKYKYLK